MSPADEPPVPKWEQVAERLEREFAGPTAEQHALAEQLGVDVIDVPAPVFAVVLHDHLAAALFARHFPIRDGDLEGLNDLETELELPVTRELVTGTKAEKAARFAATYGLKTARGLRALRPQQGDIVRLNAPEREPQLRREISSIGDNGRIYLRGLPSKSAWPNYLTVIARAGEAGHEEAQAALDAALLNDPSRVGGSVNFAALRDLDPYLVDNRIPPPEATLELERRLVDERTERSFQELLERYPSLLACLVAGNWQTYVIPQGRLGSEYVTDFLVLGINSLGMQWVAVELEAPTHPLHNQDGSLPGGVRHAIGQIDSWREWLTSNVAYAQRARRDDGLGLYGITNNDPGLVIIGRGEPTTERDAQRRREAERADIEIHSYDWLLRQALSLQANALSLAPVSWNEF